MHMLLILFALCLRKPNRINLLFSIAYTFTGNGCRGGDITCSRLSLDDSFNGGSTILKHLLSMRTESENRCKVEIDLGIASSRDPENAFLPDLYARTPTIYSPWYTRACPVCQDKFRAGDRVRLCPGANGKRCGRAYHDD